MQAESNMMIDRARAYGDGLFETIAIRDGAARFWDLHKARLHTGCTRLAIACPTDSELNTELDSAIVSSDIDLSFASARLVVAAGNSKRGYRRAAGRRAELSIDLFPSSPLPAELFSRGVAVRKCELRLAEQPALAGIKSLNRLEQVLARAEWTDPAVFEGLTLDTAERVICGTMSNVFAVIDSTVCTPALNHCGVAGIMRAQVLHWLREADVAVLERDIDHRELHGAAELFLTNSQFGVLPVRAVERSTFSIGPYTRRAQGLAGANGVPECLP